LTTKPPYEVPTAKPVESWRRDDLTLGRSVAVELVGDQHTRRLPLLAQELAEQAFGGLLVAPALDEDIENKALPVDSAPEPVLLASDGEDDFVKAFLGLAKTCRKLGIAF